MVQYRKYLLVTRDGEIKKNIVCSQQPLCVNKKLLNESIEMNDEMAVIGRNLQYVPEGANIHSIMLVTIGSSKIALIWLERRPRRRKSKPRIGKSMRITRFSIGLQQQKHICKLTKLQHLIFYSGKVLINAVNSYVYQR